MTDRSRADQRLDRALAEAGLAPSRARAQAVIKAGVVTVDGVVETKPSRLVGAEAQLAVAEDPNPWVSRAGLKLAHALEVFGWSPADRVVLDIGASTGGFTEVCLARRARRVYALDVGRGQLHPKIAADPRVVELSGLNAKDLTRAHAPEPIDWFVADVSFISLTKAMPAPLALAAQSARLVALVKPQFEVGRAQIGKGGVVRDADARREAVASVRAFLEAQGWSATEETISPILGGDGNEEFLIAATRR